MCKVFYMTFIKHNLRYRFFLQLHNRGWKNSAIRGQLLAYLSKYIIIMNLYPANLCKVLNYYMLTKPSRSRGRPITDGI